jgi:hypothetical protein
MTVQPHLFRDKFNLHSAKGTVSYDRSASETAAESCLVYPRNVLPDVVGGLRYFMRRYTHHVDKTRFTLANSNGTHKLRTHERGPWWQPGWIIQHLGARILQAGCLIGSQTTNAEFHRRIVPVRNPPLPPGRERSRLSAEPLLDSSKPHTDVQRTPSIISRCGCDPLGVGSTNALHGRSITATRTRNAVPKYTPRRVQSSEPRPSSPATITYPSGEKTAPERHRPQP